MKLTGLDKLKLSLDLLDKADDLLFPLEEKGVIGDDIRNCIMEAIDEIEDLIEEEK